MNSWPTHLKYLYTANQKTKDKIKEIQRWTNKRFNYAYSAQNYKILLMCFLKQTHKNKDFNYETLEWIGDSLIGFLVLIHIFRRIPFETNLTPDFEEIDRKQNNIYLTEGHYSELKLLLTENDTFCRFMNDGNTDFQCQRIFAYYINLLNKHELFNSNNKENYDVTESVNYCEKSFSNLSKPSTIKNENRIIKGTEKQFADVFEAIVAAIYLDLNCDLDKLYEYFEPIIDQIVQQTIEYVKKCSHEEFIDKNDSSKGRESRGREKKERLLQNLKRLRQ